MFQSFIPSFITAPLSGMYILVKVPAEYITGYKVRGMCREANKARGGAECFIRPRDTFRVRYIR